MKFCKDCQYYKPHWITYLFDGFHSLARCVHPDALRTTVVEDPVSGEKTTIEEKRSCAIMRAYECGKNAKWFKARKDDFPR